MMTPPPWWACRRHRVTWRLAFWPWSAPPGWAMLRRCPRCRARWALFAAAEPEPFRSMLYNAVGLEPPIR